MIDWKALYAEKNEYLDTYCEQVTPYEFYRDIFPAGSFERLGHTEDGKPNGLALDIKGKGAAFHTIITDSLEQIQSLLQKDFVIMAPISYFGARRSAENARFMYAMAFDLDGVEMGNLRDVLHQMNRGFLPKASYIVNSGHGLHLYYVFPKPVPLYPRNQAYLKEMKFALTRQIWNRYTSNRKDVETQGIMQGFRMVGSPSKFGKEYPVTAFRFGGRITLDELFGFVPATSGERDIIRHTLDKIPMEKAKKLYPDWYERRIVQGDKSRKLWTVKRDLYDWWRGRVADEIKMGHRYYGMMALAIYAKKCGIPEDELRRDAYDLLSALDALSESEDNRFTEDDIESALALYADCYATFPRDDIAKLTALKMKENKRNGRKQNEHLGRIRALQAFDYPNGEWRNKQGRPSARQIVEKYIQEHPEETNKSAIARVTGLSRPTVIKYYAEVRPAE